ncbi:MAG: hypothetical protein HOV68_29030 [Streptomycetaceae bacterium]|nr:hypothetical protein [Streptomycetaceae bacterium]
MLDLEDQVNRVFNPEVRGLVREAYRCYTAGSSRAAIILTWTAVCADIIAKAQILREEGEADARDVVAEVEKAQTSSEVEGTRIMQGVERDLPATAEKLQLIDFTQRRLLERIRDDRHLCAHPSIRPLGELYEPTSEYARAHLAAALDALLVHPPSQGRKLVESFRDHVADPGFIYDTAYLAHAFFDRVRPAARAKVVELAAKFAVLQIDDPANPVDAAVFADRMAACLRSFAERDAGLVKDCVAKQMVRLGTATPEVQLNALGRLGDMPAFWAALTEPLRGLLDARIETVGSPPPGRIVIGGKLKPVEARVLALVGHADVRKQLPALAAAFESLSALKRAQVIEQRPDPYFATYLPQLMTNVRSFDTGQAFAEQAVLPCAGHLTRPQLEELLTAWFDNSQCWGRAMPGYLVELYRRPAHLGPDRGALWDPALDDLDDDARAALERERTKDAGGDGA